QPEVNGRAGRGEDFSLHDTDLACLRGGGLDGGTAHDRVVSAQARAHLLNCRGAPGGDRHREPDQTQGLGRSYSAVHSPPERSASHTVSYLELSSNHRAFKVFPYGMVW